MKGDKFVIVSDAHRGTGDTNDNFAQNQNIYFHALSHYYDRGYTYIELGDGDELWENKRFEPIIAEYSHIFWLLDRFYKDGRLIMLYGNHDMVKRNPAFRSAHMSELPAEPGYESMRIFTGLDCPESLILSNEEHGKSFYLTHGHQVEPLNSTFWRLARFLVRHLWRPMESLGFKQPLGTAEHRNKKETAERRLIKWCADTGKSLIAGHTHRPRFPEPGAAQYFNSGSCVHPRCITALEICYGTINLVKWAVESGKDGTLKIARTELASRDSN
jgi:predicted phosphodiesterase